MLLRFVASNFLSIADEIDFNMFPAPKLKTHKNHVYKTAQVDVLKAAAIYGANGSGKSNLVIAMAYLQYVILTGDIDIHNDSYFKLNPLYKKKPISFEIEFKIDDTFFAYGIMIQNDNILEEWLLKLDNISNEKSTAIFERTYNNGKIKLNVHERYIKTEKDKLRIELYEEEILDSSMPFLTFAQDKFDIIQNIHEWFRTHFKFIMPNTKFNILEESQVNKSIIDFINNNVSKLDTGIRGISIKKIPLLEYAGRDDYEELKRYALKEMKYEETNMIQYENDEDILITKDEADKLWAHSVNTKHLDESSNEILFEVGFESDGTKRLLDLMPLFNIIQNQETTIIIDEIGRSIHPVILKKLIELIMKTETKGQIIFTTHESQLLDLDIFRSDEIWFTEKDKFGKTSIYPLSDFKPRYDLNIQKGYLNGRFGAIPFLGDLKQLKLEENHAEA